MKKVKKNLLVFSLPLLVLALGFGFSTEKSEAQTTVSIPCPSGDTYTCYTVTEAGTGNSYDVKKGAGDTTATIIKKQ